MTCSRSWVRMYWNASARRLRPFVRFLPARPLVEEQMGTTASNDGGFAALESRVQSNPFRQIDPAKPVWIFGAGRFAQDLARAMRARGIEVAGFVETVPRKTSALGLDVIDWKTLASREKQAQ